MLHYCCVCGKALSEMWEKKFDGGDTKQEANVFCPKCWEEELEIMEEEYKMEVYKM